MTSLHRFHNEVAIEIQDSRTHYISASMARSMAKALLIAARSIETEAFSASNVGTIEIVDKSTYGNVYAFCVPATMEMGTYANTCSTVGQATYKQDALNDYNSARAHDNLQPLSRMPKGTTYTAKEIVR